MNDAFRLSHPPQIQPFFQPRGGLLESSWGSLGALLGPLGDLLESLWASRSLQGAFQAESSTCSFGSPVWTPSGSRLRDLLGCLGGLLAGLGALFNRFGALLEASWAILVRS